MMTKVYAHKGVGIDCKLSGGVSVVAPAGGMTEANLTGDQLGKVEAYLASQEVNMRLGPNQFGGRVVCPERDAAPPPGSKKAIVMMAEKTAGKVIATVPTKNTKDDD